LIFSELSLPLAISMVASQNSWRWGKETITKAPSE
jgi:hypothetical protein